MWGFYWSTLYFSAIWVKYAVVNAQLVVKLQRRTDRQTFEQAERRRRWKDGRQGAERQPSVGLHVQFVDALAGLVVQDHGATPAGRQVRQHLRRPNHVGGGDATAGASTHDRGTVNVDGAVDVRRVERRECPTVDHYHRHLTYATAVRSARLEQQVAQPIGFQHLHHRHRTVVRWRRIFCTRLRQAASWPETTSNRPVHNRLMLFLVRTHAVAL